MTTLREKVERLAEKWERFSGSLLCLSGVESDRLFICARELRALLASPEATTAEVARLREERDGAREAKIRAQAERDEARRALDNARFWADEFADDSLELTVFTLYAYVVHWHRAAEALAGGPGKALALYPPPDDAKIRADFDETRSAALASLGSPQGSPQDERNTKKKDGR
jgi:hypothetical protein